MGSSRTTMKILSVPTALLATAVFLASVDLAASAAAEMGGCYDRITHITSCHGINGMAWNGTMCNGTKDNIPDRGYMAREAFIPKPPTKNCNCANHNTPSCYKTPVASCTASESQCKSDETALPPTYKYGGSDTAMCAGGCVQRSGKARTQYGYCKDMSTNTRACALHEGHCKAGETFQKPRDGTIDCPCHKVKVGACKRTKVCPKKCSPSEYSHNAAGAACTVDTTVAGYGNIRCVIDSDSCKDDEEYMAPRSTDAASCTLCDESDYKPLAVATTAAAPAATPAPAPAATPAPASSSAAASLPVQGTMLKGLLVCHLVVAMRSFA